MGCFSWIFSKKEKSRKKKKARKDSGQTKPCGDGLANLKTAIGGVAFEVDIKPAMRAPPMKHKFLDSLKSAEERATLVNLRRLEEMVKRGEAAKEAARKRELCLEKKAEQGQMFVEKTKLNMAKKNLPDEAEVKANMKALDKRCKTARTRQRIGSAFKLRGSHSMVDRKCEEGTAPSSASAE